MLRHLSSTLYLDWCKNNIIQSNGSNLTKKGILLPCDKVFLKDPCEIAWLLTNAIMDCV